MPDSITTPPPVCIAREEMPMRTIVAAAVLDVVVVLGFIIVSKPAQASIPCEDMQQQLRAGRSSAELTGSDVERINELEAKAVERSNANDDAHPDRLLAEAMTIMRLESTDTP
jgi:hypothetical protein